MPKCTHCGIDLPIVGPKKHLNRLPYCPDCYDFELSQLRNTDFAPYNKLIDKEFRLAKVVVLLILILATSVAGRPFIVAFEQEKSPTDVCVALVKLMFTSQRIVKISDNPERWITNIEDIRLHQNVSKGTWVSTNLLASGFFRDDLSGKIKRGDSRMLTSSYVIVEYGDWH